MPDLKVNLGKLELKNPVVLASGTFDRTITKHINVNNLGAITTKTITLKPRQRNPLPHIIKTKYGFLNSVGLKNPGIKKYLGDELPFWKKYNTKIITSIGGENLKEYLELSKILNSVPIDALEVNVSCPNVEKGGMAFGTNPELLAKLVKNIRNNFKKNLIIKLTPNITDIALMAKIVLKSGADIISCTNTFLGLEIDNSQKKARFARVTGGYSGPAIKPMALYAIYKVYKTLKCPIIGGGGIVNFSDALDFIMVGAEAVSVGSGMYLDQKLPVKIVKGFEKYLRDQKIDNLNKIRGII